MRYIITRPCLQEGSLRLLKYLAATFPAAGPITFVDDQGHDHAAHVDLHAGRITGLGSVYHAQNLGVNDVLMITPLAAGRYQIEAIVKPYAPPPAPRREQQSTPKPETRRVVVSTTPHVREVRLQEVRPDQPATAPAAHTPAATEAARPVDARLSAARTPELRAAPEPAEPAPKLTVQTAARTSQSHADAARTDTPRPEARRAEPARQEAPRAESVKVTPRPAPAAPRTAVTASVRPMDVRFDAPAEPVPLRAAPLPPTPLNAAEDTLADLARLTGYRLENLSGGVLRLNADLGPHSYSVLVATSEAAVRTPAWKEQADYCVLLTGEGERPQNTPRLTREALDALIEHAQLAPLTPVDLRGYWKAGSVDLEAADSVAELVGAHLAQRGAFSVVLLTLAQQPAHSVVSVQRLAERLGSGVNYAELGTILDTLTRAPFLALTPLPGGQYLLRTGVGDLLTDLAEYADGVRRRMRVPAREAVPA
ncbi:hypothetical protein LAJ19_00665 [Deinococcus taeanensis]|uniref:hypothetical protein n=1 Tax=Deinococcus taeanensis TaxID=2737050 RepID=UPI001CDB4D01|nr:hypothetical protein [Deinococcus taeanensis]UBV43950.1 hypothetical protein LAJ19_00665 [Deinococcus taeanensis]